MLILTRHTGESIKIGDDICMTVLGISGNQVRIGVKAPKKIAVHREEIYRRIQQEPRTQEQHQAKDHQSETRTRFYSTEGNPSAPPKKPKIIHKKRGFTGGKS